MRAGLRELGPPVFHLLDVDVCEAQGGAELVEYLRARSADALGRADHEHAPPVEGEGVT
jgi:hypothetical protein